MKYLTVPEYAKLKRTTHQNIYAKIKRGTLAFKQITIKKKEVRIPVEDTEYKKIKG